MSLLGELRRIARERCTGTDPAHDFQHVARVAATVRALARKEGGDAEVAEAAAWLHELFHHPKDHPDSALSGERCAERARAVLEPLGFRATDAVCYAIRVHSYSRGIVPETLEARLLQDADRLDAIGAIGVARCFATCAALGRPFYSPEDPFCRNRAPDDRAYGLDHFFTKLLRIGESLHTGAARAEAAPRLEFLREFLAALEREIAAGGERPRASPGRPLRD